MKHAPPTCPNCGGTACLPIDNRPGWLRCVTCSREFEPAAPPATAMPVHPGPSLRDPAAVAATVEALTESGAISRLPDGRLALEGVPLGRSLPDAIAAVQADASLADIAAALVDADQGDQPPQDAQEPQGDDLADSEPEPLPEAEAPSSEPARGHGSRRGRNASREG